jgi:hypothetical protein
MPKRNKINTLDNITVNFDVEHILAESKVSRPGHVLDGGGRLLPPGPGPLPQGQYIPSKSDQVARANAELARRFSERGFDVVLLDPATVKPVTFELFGKQRQVLNSNYELVCGLHRNATVAILTRGLITVVGNTDSRDHMLGEMFPVDTMWIPCEEGDCIRYYRPSNCALPTKEVTFTSKTSGKSWLVDAAPDYADARWPIHLPRTDDPVSPLPDILRAAIQGA